MVLLGDFIRFTAKEDVINPVLKQVVEKAQNEEELQGKYWKNSKHVYKSANNSIKKNGKFVPLKSQRQKVCNMLFLMIFL